MWSLHLIYFLKSPDIILFYLATLTRVDRQNEQDRLWWCIVFYFTLTSTKKCVFPAIYLPVSIKNRDTRRFRSAYHAIDDQRIPDLRTPLQSGNSVFTKTFSVIEILCVPHLVCRIAVAVCISTQQNETNSIPI